MGKDSVRTQIEPAQSGAGSTFVKTNAPLIGVLALGHLAVDMNQGAFPAILPLLKSALHLSYSSAGVLVFVSNVTSSAVQPVFGLYADRHSHRWMLPVAVLCAGAGMSLIGFARSYWTVLGFLLLMSLGIAAYHPEAYRTATAAAGNRRATALSWFSLGGNVGYALGPVYVTALVTELGIYGTAGTILPAFLVAGLVLFYMPRLMAYGPATQMPGHLAGSNRPRAMALLIAVIMVRSWTQLGFATFLPFYYTDYLKGPPRLVGPLLFVFLGAGALGTIFAGPLADRWGARRYTVWAILASSPLACGYLLLRGPLSWVVLGLFGIVLVSTFAITVVLGQQYLPRSPALASGLIVGFAVGAGGAGVAMLGWVADRWGLPTVLWISALLPIAGFALARFLPSPEKR
jgi:MFS transporter, FSR family, fosmidomycin resistance protein